MRQSNFDEIVDRYEAALVDENWQTLDIANFLPSASSPDYWPTLVELLRIRMEHAFADQRPIGVAECVSQFPALLKQTDHLSELAFEEFRLKQNAGHAITPDDFRERWQVDVSSWRASKNVEHQPNSATPSKACAISLSPGQPFGPFKILCLLGKGALSKVYLAQQIDLSERAVVLKVCSQATLEPQKIALLQHPNIVQIFSVHEISGYQVLCMPYAGATTLADLLLKFEQPTTSTINNESTGTGGGSGHGRSSQQLVTTLSNRQREVQTLVDHSQQQIGSPRPIRLNHGLTWPDRWKAMHYEAVFCELLLQLAQGLAHAHQFGIVHSDLKPANVLIGDDGQARLVDFNVSQQADDGRQSLMGGTLPYMAPEHLESLIQDRWQAGGQSDLYSLGVIAFQLLSGRLPFATPKGSLATMLSASLEARQGKRFAHRLTSSDASQDMRSIVEKLLEPSLESRYQSAANLAEDLQRHLDYRPLKYAANRSWVQRTSKWAVRHPRLSSATSVISLAAVCVLALTVALLAYRQGYRQEKAVALVQQLRAELPSAIVLAASSAHFSNTAQAATDSAEKVLEVLRQPGDTQSKEELAYLSAEQRQEVYDGLQTLIATLLSAAKLSPARQAIRADAPVLVALSETAKGLVADSTVAGTIAQAVDRDFAELRKATDEFLSGDRQLALNKLLPLVERSPQHHAAWLLLAVCYQDSGQNDLADAAYARCLALMPKHWQAWYYRAMLMQASAMSSSRPDQFRSAETYYTQVLNLQPNLNEALFNRALCRERLGQLDLASADATNLIDRAQFLVRAHLLRARVYLKQGKAEAAKADRQQALASQPQTASDFAYLAQVRMHSDPQQAAKDLQQAFQLDPHDTEVLQYLAYLQMEIQRDGSARAWLDRWVEASPEQALPVASRAVFFARQGDADLAVADCETALSLQPKPREKVQIASTYAMLAVKSDDAVQANAYRQRALSLLAEAVQLEWRLVGEIARDPDMSSLSTDARFQMIVKTATTLGQLPKLVENP